MITAALASIGSLTRKLRSVVLPAPRKPVRTATGVTAGVFAWLSMAGSYNESRCARQSMRTHSCKPSATRPFHKWRDIALPPLALFALRRRIGPLGDRQRLLALSRE